MIFTIIDNAFITDAQSLPFDGSDATVHKQPGM